MRQGLPYLSTKYLIILSAMALIIGTTYETFITTYTVLKPPPIIYNNLKELIEDDYKIYLAARKQNLTQKVLEILKDLLYFNGMKEIGDPTLYLHFLHVGSINSTWDFWDTLPTFASDKVAGFIPSSSLSLLTELEIQYGKRATCFKTKQPLYEPWFNIDLIRLAGPSKEYLYWGFKSFQEFGIDQKIKEMSIFYDLLDSQNAKSRYVFLNRLDDPKAISLDENTVMIFYIWILLLGVSLLRFIGEIMSRKNSSTYINYSAIIGFKICSTDGRNS